QLENIIERAVVIVEGTTITEAELPREVQVVEDRRQGELSTPPGKAGIQAERAERDALERERLVRALAATDGNKAEAARPLGLQRSTLVSRLKKHGLS